MLIVDFRMLKKAYLVPERGKSGSPDPLSRGSGTIHRLLLSTQYYAAARQNRQEFVYIPVSRCGANTDLRLFTDCLQGYLVLHLFVKANDTVGKERQR
jgi:hypothetical protein